MELCALQCVGLQCTGLRGRPAQPRRDRGHSRVVERFAVAQRAVGLQLASDLRPFCVRALVLAR